MVEAASRAVARSAACALVTLSAVGGAQQRERAAELAASEPSAARPQRLPREQTKPVVGE